MTSVSSESKGFSIVQLVKLTSSPDSLYRMRWPAESLGHQVPDWKVINLDAFAEERFEYALHADLLIIFQSRDTDLLPVIQKRKAQGKKTIVEFADNFYSPQAWSPVIKEWSSPLLWQDYEAFIKESDFIQVSSQGLKELFFDQRNASEILVMPNQLAQDLLSFDQVFCGSRDIIKICWAGSQGHAADILGVAESLKHLMRKHKNLELHIMAAQDIFELLRSVISCEKMFFRPPGDFSDYIEFLTEMDLGLIPLNDTPYNRCRSDLKPLEYASCGVLPIVQNCATYRDFIDQTCSPSFRNAQELIQVTEGYIRDYEARKTSALNCYSYVKNKRLLANSRERLNLYRNLMPSSPDPFFMKIGNGYNYIQGTEAKSLPKKRVIQQAIELNKIGKSQAAIKILRQATAENQYLFDVALCELELLAQLQASDLKARFEIIHKTNRKDLRIIRLGFMHNLFPDQIKEWEKTCAILEAQPGMAKYYQQEWENLLLWLTQNSKLATDILLLFAKRLLLVYPNSIGLRAYLAESLKREGNFAESLTQFKVLRQALQMYGENGAQLKSINSAYTEVWIEALEKLQES